jgi:NAD dependent epimerase/dehydratase family enzyme
MSELVLRGSRISSGKITDAGYRFRYPDLKVALEDIIR